MAITPPIAPHHRSVDPSGRALPMTDEEILARAVEIARGLNALDDMGDEEEQQQTLDALMEMSPSGSKRLCEVVSRLSGSALREPTARQT